MEQTTRIEIRQSWLPVLERAVPGPKNILSPLQLRVAQQPDGDVWRSGLFDPQGRLLPAYMPVMQMLANPLSLVDLQFTIGAYQQQVTLYYSQPGAAPVSMHNTQNGLILEYPAKIKDIFLGVVQFSGDSVIGSLDVQLSLPYLEALALAGLIDLHRRQAARAFADVTAPSFQPIPLSDLANWLTRCPNNPQWLTAIIRKPDDPPPSWDLLQSAIMRLAARGACRAEGAGYLLSDMTMPVSDRLFWIDRVFSLSIARLNSGAPASVALIMAVQAGVNDVLRIEFAADEVAFTGVSPRRLVEEVFFYLEDGGFALPAPETSPAYAPSTPQPGNVASSAPTMTLQPPPTATAKLVALNGPLANQEFPLRDSMRLGRERDNDLSLPDQQASRHHAVIQLREGRYWISDLNSRNGTLVNGVRIAQATPLTTGDVIQIGDTRLRFSA